MSMKPPVPARQSHVAAFTLVELLVVVAIIAILLSLLLPTLNRTRYQARITVCSSKMHQIGLGLLNYSIAHKGRMPERPGFTPDIGTSVPSILAQLGPIENNDLRPLFRPYVVKINGLFRCPFVDKVDLELVVPRLEVECSYDMWFNWPEPPLGGSANAPDITDVMEDVDETFTNAGKDYNVLISTRSGRDVAGVIPDFTSSHPDYPRNMFGPISADGIFIGSNQRVFSFYRGTSWELSQLDRNFLFSDGHTKTFSHIKFPDPRMGQVRVHWGRLVTQLPPNE
jgi:prepilin-type N-terminal cleavage/methylation domain-containing protein